MTTKICPHCGGRYLLKRHNQTYCSSICQIGANTARHSESRAKQHREREAERYRNGGKIRKQAQAIARRDGRPAPMFCEDCGVRPPIDRHHDDYTKPLEIKWLCRQCHMKWHATHDHPNPTGNFLTPRPLAAD